jgi:hypothetical protein
LTLTEARSAVKKSRSCCCAIANGPVLSNYAENSASALIGSAVVPIRILEMNPAKPQAALSAAALGGSFASHLLLGNSLAEALLRVLGILGHGELP